MIIEDNFLIAQEVIELLAPAGFQLVGQFSTYSDGLKNIDLLPTEFCILDLDLGGGLHSGFGPGEEGRRLLSLLSAKKIPTVIYSAFTRMQHQLNRINSEIVVVDKLEPAENVIAALLRLREN